MKLKFVLVLLVVVLSSYAYAQRVYYQAGGYSPSSSRRVYHGLRNRLRLENGFSTRLQQTTDESEETTNSNNNAGGLGFTNGNDENGVTDSDVNSVTSDSNYLDDSDTDVKPGSTKGRSNSISGNDDTSDENGISDNVSTPGEDDSSSEESTPSTNDNSLPNSSTEENSEEAESLDETEKPGIKNPLLSSNENSDNNSDKSGSSDENLHENDEENHDHGDSIDWLKNAVQGEPGVDYPIYSEIPSTSFKCVDHKLPGYYGDVEAKCQVFHICQADGRMDSFLCPNGTIFAQNYFVCVWWHDFDCSKTESFYDLNENLYKPGKGIDGSDVLVPTIEMMNGLMPLDRNNVIINSNKDETSEGSNQSNGNSIEESDVPEDESSTEGDNILKNSGEGILNKKTNINRKGLKNKINIPKMNGDGFNVNNNKINGKTNFNGLSKTKPDEINAGDQEDNNDNIENDQEDQTNPIQPSTDSFNEPVTESTSSEKLSPKSLSQNPNPQNTQINIDEPEINNKVTDEFTTLTPNTYNSITENPAAEEVTDVTSDNEENSSSTEDSGQSNDVQIVEKDKPITSARKASRARLAYLRNQYKPVSGRLRAVNNVIRRSRFSSNQKNRNLRRSNSSSSNRKRLSKSRSNTRRSNSNKLIHKNSRQSKRLRSSKKHRSLSKNRNKKKNRASHSNSRSKRGRTNAKKRTNHKIRPNRRSSARRLIVLQGNLRKKQLSNN